MPDLNAQVLVIADDPVSAARLLALMPSSWQRGGSGFQESAPNRFDGALALLWEADTSRFEALARSASGTGSATAAATQWDGTFKIDLAEQGTRRPVRGRVELSVRMYASSVFAETKTRVDDIVKALGSFGSKAKRRRVVVLGVVDLTLGAAGTPDVDAGVDRILEAVIRAARRPDLVLTVAVVCLGFEREFARVDLLDRRSALLRTYGGSASVRTIARDQAVILEFLYRAIHGRPYLVSLMQAATAAGSLAGPLTFTAAMPCGFHAGWEYLNYDAVTDAWLDDFEAVRFKTLAMDIVPHDCADALLAALMGWVTPFQMTPERYAARAPGAAERTA